MNISVRWLKDMVPGLSGTPEEIADHLALRGAPVASVSSPGDSLSDVVVGQVVTARQHPNADRLSVCEVDGGGGTVQVVCGALNVKEGTCYAFAPVGAVLPGGVLINSAKIRGEVSNGMLCSPNELGLGADQDGIMELADDLTPGESFVAALALDDQILDVEVTANRGDLLSHLGVARELASEGDGTAALSEIPNDAGVILEYIEGAGEVAGNGVAIRITDADLCPRYLGAVVRGVRIGPSPDWLQQRLRGAGKRPINNVVDATNYVMLELGQPMHAFDLDRLAGPAIVVRRAERANTTFTTLDSEERTIKGDMLMICDADRPIAIAGVMGGLDSEVESTTRDVLLECALFNTKSIRATRKALALSTDASYRFERGVDPGGMRQAVERCVALIVTTAGGRVDDSVLDCHPVRFEPAVISLRLSRIEHLLGIPFEADYVTDLLRPLGYTVERVVDGELQVRVPGYRSYDVTREVDLIEEVARTHGYDAFPAELGPYRPGSVPDDPRFLLEDELRAELASRGWLEAHTPAFAPPGEGDVEVANPLAATEPFMRRDLLPALLRRLAYNLAHGNRDVRLFEIGTSFRRAGPGQPPHEESHLCVVATGRREPPHWSRPDEELEIWDLKALLEDIVAHAYQGVAVVTPTTTKEVAALDPEASFVVTVESGASVGWGGQIAKGVVDVPVWAGNVIAFELSLPAVIATPSIAKHQALPQHPATERDLALLVPDEVAADAVDALIRSSAGARLEALTLFDIYLGEGVPVGARSLAFRLRFRSPKLTLKDEEVDRSVNNIRQRLEEELGVTTRG